MLRINTTNRLLGEMLCVVISFWVHALDYRKLVSCCYNQGEGCAHLLDNKRKTRRNKHHFFVERFLAKRDIITTILFGILYSCSNH